jgi:hypothetical protein
MKRTEGRGTHKAQGGNGLLVIKVFLRAVLLDLERGGKRLPFPKGSEQCGSGWLGSIAALPPSLRKSITSVPRHHYEPSRVSSFSAVSAGLFLERAIR